MKTMMTIFITAVITVVITAIATIFLTKGAYQYYNDTHQASSLSEALSKEDLTILKSVTGTDSKGQEKTVHLDTLAKKELDMSNLSAMGSMHMRVLSMLVSCPPLAAGEPTQCMAIMKKVAGLENGVWKPEHCHCYNW